ncbi:MAG TPA: YidB family protein [Syntrophorhabdales bacterium]|nr:YidB family protein [Syntrophorhabdales bacterium]
MGILDELVKTAAGAVLGGSGQGGLVEHALGLMNNPGTGGLTGLIEQFKSKGLGDAVSSWIGQGENQAISGEAIANIVGSDKVQQIAGILGMSSSEAANGLATVLPHLIDQLTPDGKVPEGGLLEQGLNILKQKLS